MYRRETREQTIIRLQGRMQEMEAVKGLARRNLNQVQEQSNALERSFNLYWDGCSAHWKRSDAGKEYQNQYIQNLQEYVEEMSELSLEYTKASVEAQKAYTELRQIQ